MRTEFQTITHFQLQAIKSNEKILTFMLNFYYILYDQLILLLF